MSRQIRKQEFKHWCFTINNPNPDDALAIAMASEYKHFKYCVYQLEKGKNGTEHFQGYIEFKRTMCLSTVKSLLGGRVHLERRRGTQTEARDYCMKKEDRVAKSGPPVELGTYTVCEGPGARTDIATMCAAIKNNPYVVDIAKMYPHMYIKYHKGIHALCTVYQPLRTKPPNIVLFFGTTGTGKTRDAFRLYKNVFRKAPDTRWFDGYHNQQTLLLDDFCGRMSKMSLSYLLQLLDRYDIRIEIKCSYTNLVSTTIVITTNIHPWLWYDYSEREEQYKALARRITKVMWYTHFNEPPVEVTKDSFFIDYAAAQHSSLSACFQVEPIKPKLEREGGQMDLRDYVIINDSSEDSYEFP